MKQCSTSPKELNSVSFFVGVKENQGWQMGLTTYVQTSRGKLTPCHRFGYSLYKKCQKKTTYLYYTLTTIYTSSVK